MLETRLSNQEGYYAEPMKVRGVTYFLRELSDEAYATYLRDRKALGVVGGLDALQNGEHREEAMQLLTGLIPVSEQQATAAPEMAAQINLQNSRNQARLVELLREAGIDAQDPALGVAMRSARRTLLDGIVVNGVADWDLADKGKKIDCSAENKQSLPGTIKAILAARIITLTELQAEEGGFF